MMFEEVFDRIAQTVFGLDGEDLRTHMDPELYMKDREELKSWLNERFVISNIKQPNANDEHTLDALAPRHF